MIEWQPYDKQDIADVFDDGKKLKNDEISVSCGTRLADDGDGWGLYLGHLMMARADSKRAVDTAFDLLIEWLRIPPGQRPPSIE